MGDSSLNSKLNCNICATCDYATGGGGARCTLEIGKEKDNA